ncbi:MAG: plasmid replication protein, CyRepA1 family [Xenococcus sp. (in: cyanobacteria)]
MNCLEEWSASGVDEELTRLNVVPLEGIAASEYLLYSDDIPRRNDGRISETFLQLYSHTVEGGWWCSGIDLLTGEEDVWGCFKPDYPRQSGTRPKPIKYEHPPKTPTGVFALKVTIGIWEKIASRYKVDLAPEEINHSLPDLGFWQWVINHSEIPLCLTEGAKKAGALLSAGYVAIALPGINNGYRTPKDENGKRIGKSFLIPQLEIFTRKETERQGREIYLVFDCDIKPNTIKAVNAAIKKHGYLFQQRNCQVKVVTWDSQLGKGVDDLIINQGVESFARAYDNALSLEIWQAKTWTQLTYAPEVVVNSPYLLNIDVEPKNKLIGIKSPKGTGKTKLLENFVSKALEKSQKILVIGHRVQLVKALCQRFGLPYVTQVRDNPKMSNLGYGLCIDSLHPNSQAEFNPDDWSDSIVIIDEVEQVLWHGLNSTTCKDQRVTILKSLKTLIQNVVLGSGQVYVADADLSNIAIDYLRSLTGIDLQPFIIENKWKPDQESSWSVYNYDGKSPKKLVNDLETHIQQGGKPLVCLSAQKLTSKWGTQTLEAYLSQKFPDKKILRIDSESLVDPHHPAYDCISNLDRVLANFDIVLASPSIETGISIELKNHFTSVWAIAQGIQGENTVRQTLARLRTNVPRYLWCASYSFLKIGNGSTSIPNLITSGHRLTQLNIRLLQQSDLESLDDIDTGFQAESLLCWAKMAVRYNASTIKYRESILAALKEEGHEILDAKTVKFPVTQSKNSLKKTSENSCLLEAITEIRQQNYQAECKAIAEAPLLTKNKYQALKKRLVKNIAQRRSIRKYELQQRYSLPVTAQLVALDDNGWYEKIQLHYFLTIGRSFLADRDTQIAQKLIQNGNGSIFIPDFNISQLGAVVGTMEILGIPTLLADTSRELRNNDPDLQELAAIAIANKREIKTVMGIGLAKNSSPILILRRFLEKIDYGLKYLRCESKDKGRKRIRIYKIMAPQDARTQVFSHWIKRDQALPGSSLFWEQDQFKVRNVVSSENNHDFLQLSLDL